MQKGCNSIRSTKADYRIMKYTNCIQNMDRDTSVHFVSQYRLIMIIQVLTESMQMEKHEALQENVLPLSICLSCKSQTLDRSERRTSCTVHGT